MSGTFMAFEGIDGSGKTTLAAIVSQALREKGLDVEVIRTKTDAQEVDFQRFVDGFGLASNSLAYMFLFQAMHARKWELVRDARSAGKIVIADRWNYSFYVYHNCFGPLKDLPDETKHLLDLLAFHGMRPDLLFFVEIDPGTAIMRRKRRGDEIPDPNTEELYYSTVANEYRRLVGIDRGIILDGNRDWRDLTNEVLDTVQSHLLL
jgi:dTMP kinase